MLKAKRRTFASYQEDNEAMNEDDTNNCTPCDADIQSSKRQRRIAPQVQQLPLLPTQQLPLLPTPVPVQQALNVQKETQFKSNIQSPAEIVVAYKKLKSKSNNKKIVLSDEDAILLLEHQGKMLRDEYDNILRERLQEQFSNFSQFSQDCVSRQFNNRNFSYTS